MEVATTHCTSMGQTISNIVGVVARDKSAELSAIQYHQPQPQSPQYQSTSQQSSHPQQLFPSHHSQSRLPASHRPLEHQLPPLEHKPLAHQPPPPFQQHPQQQQVPNSPFMNYSASSAQQSTTPPAKSHTWYSIPNHSFETPMYAPLLNPQVGDTFAPPPYIPPSAELLQW